MVRVKVRLGKVINTCTSAHFPRARCLAASLHEFVFRLLIDMVKLGLLKLILRFVRSFVGLPGSIITTTPFPRPAFLSFWPTDDRPYLDSQGPLDERQGVAQHEGAGAQEALHP